MCIHVHVGAGVNSPQTPPSQPETLVSFDVVTQVFDEATSIIQTMYAHMLCLTLLLGRTLLIHSC